MGLLINRVALAIKWVGAPIKWVGQATNRVGLGRGRFRLLGDDHLLSHNLVVGTGTILAGAMGVAFQSLVSHQLKPADFGAVFVVLTLVTFIGMPASAFTLLMAREASRDRALGDADRSGTLLRKGNRLLLLGGLAIGALVAIASPWLSGFLGAEPKLVLAAAAGIPFGIALPLLLGEFQGDQRFTAYAGLSAGQATLKLVAAVALGLVLGPVGVIAGISIASIASYAAALWMLRARRAGAEDRDWWRPAARYLAIIVPSTLALALLLSSDVVLVKHYFGAREAGEYSAVAALGRAIFWGASGVAAVLFPKVVFRAARGEHASLVVLASLGLVALGGLAALAVLSLLSSTLLTAFAGHAYAGGAAYLPWYAIGMTLLGATAVLTATHQSRGRARFLAVLLPLSFLEPVLIALFHRTVIEVVQVVDVSTALSAAGLAAWYLVDDRARPRSVVFPSPGLPQSMEGSR